MYDPLTTYNTEKAMVGLVAVGAYMARVDVWVIGLGLELMLSICG